MGGEGQEPEEEGLKLGGEGTPEELQARIEAFQRRQRAQPGFGRAVALVMSLGVTFVLILYGSFLLGTELSRRTGASWWLPACLLAGAAAGFWAGFLLIRPLLREDR